MDFFVCTYFVVACFPCVAYYTLAKLYLEPRQIHDDFAFLSFAFPSFAFPSFAFLSFAFLTFAFLSFAFLSFAFLSFAFLSLGEA